MFWDSSALVPFLLPEFRSASMTGLLRGDRLPVIWWVTPIECESAIWRRQRLAPVALAVRQQAFARLAGLVTDAHTIEASAPVRLGASRLLVRHPLRAADALQLAAALVWCREQPSAEGFVCLDDRLRDAARAEGFAILPE